MKNLVIVESPTKAKTIARYLDSSYEIVSSYGHVRDLPSSKMGVAIPGFEPSYIIPTRAKKNVTALKKQAQKATIVYLATDEDREGEAIAWHLEEALCIPKEKIKRITFHEITKEAILASLEHPRDIDLKLVDAQQARRILDRLVGYELSPFLWKKIYRGLSAGRVQSVAVRLIAEREAEIKKFKPEEYWTIDAKFEKLGETFAARLKKDDLKNKETSEKILEELRNAAFRVGEVKQKEARRSPLPPFTTSTLQQEANHRMGYSAKQTMMFAQRLYELGHITYMRTDSVNLAQKFIGEAAAFIQTTYGKEYVDSKQFKGKQKNAQEAHEAIRPTNVSTTPEKLEAKEFKLYDLIFRRAVASQMSRAQTLTTSVAIANNKNDLLFRAAGTRIAFPGWLKVYPDRNKENLLPELGEGDALKLEEMQANQHFTEPPAHYTEAALVKALEEKGIGRPSTYAPTIATILERKYIQREKTKLLLTELGELVNRILVEHFGNIVDYGFTATMENDLDSIALGEKPWKPIIENFYMPFKEQVEEKEKLVSKKELTEVKTDEVCDKCGAPMVNKLGRFGRFLACSKFPDCRNTKKIASTEIKTGVTCPECKQGDIIERRTRKGKIFYSCNRFPACRYALWDKPTGEVCEACGKLLVEKGKNILCSSSECPTRSKKS